MDLLTSQARDRVRTANDLALVRVLKQTGVIIPAKDLPNWRPTKESTGEIGGVTSATILATDGNLGLFVQYADDLTYANTFFGHVQHFDGDVKTLHGMPTPYRPPVDKDPNAPKRVKKPSKLKSKRDEAIAQRVIQLLTELDELDN